jgi:hypothetical protein
MIVIFQRYWVFGLYPSSKYSIVQVLKDKTKEEHDFSETGSVSVLR